MAISKSFTPNCVCVLTNKDKKHIRKGFLFCHRGHAPGVGLCGNWGTQRVKHFFFKQGHVAYQIDGDDEQNKMQVTFLS